MGQSVTLCTKKTMKPSTVPPGGHAVDYIGTYWRKEGGAGNWEDLYKIFGYCGRVKQLSSSINYTHYSDVSAFCLTIGSVQENEAYSVHLSINPELDYSSRTAFFSLSGIIIVVGFIMPFVHNILT